MQGINKPQTLEKAIEKARNEAKAFLELSKAMKFANKAAAKVSRALWDWELRNAPPMIKKHF